MRIKGISDLTHLREKKDRENLSIKFDDRNFSGNLPLYLLKYGIWSLRQGGILLLEAPTLLDSMALRSGRLSFQLLVQLAAKASEGIGVLKEVDLKARRIVIKRTLSRSNEKWSAGIIFSGNAHEVPSLLNCLEGLRHQKELASTNDIVVCGPEEGRRHLPPNANVNYLVYETPFEAGRFLVGRKKNFLLRELKHDKALICHARIILRPGALAALPAEFDLITPKVFYRGKYKSLPYLDLGFMKLGSISMVGKGLQPPLDYPRERWLNYLNFFYPYIDGGLFCVKRNLALTIPLHDRIAWGEGEDAEWCLRMLNQGNLIELAHNQKAAADSASCKIPHYANYGHMRSYRIVGKFWRIMRNLYNY